MSKVDPYIVNPPKAFTSDPELAVWYNYTNRFLHDLWQAVTDGTGDPDEVESVEGQTTSYRVGQNSALIAQLLERMECLERTIEVKSALAGAVSSASSDVSMQIQTPAISTDFKSITVTENTTLNNYNFANVKNGATVTLPQYPIENSVIIIRNGDGSTVKIDANGKTLNGETTGKLYRKGTAITIQYFIDSDEWLIR